MARLKVTLCLGSSCHSRGNRSHVESLKAALADQSETFDIDLKGNLCLGRCAEGPLVLIDGQQVAVTPETDLVALIRSRLAAKEVAP